YRYFEFTASGDASYKDRPYVSPEILYRLAPSDPVNRAELRLNSQTHHWEVAQTGFQVDFVGAVANENRFLSVAQTGPGEASIAFGIIISQLPPSAWVDVQLIYSSRSGYSEYQPDAFPRLVVTRAVFGGNERSAKKTAGPLELGQVTKF
ncbi:MAG TPA: hypothetical protein VK731_14225, partial [Candidatus Cybelea sp.]|nr:hypothetical protein [Candidatus Cybelea sp.]